MRAKEQLQNEMAVHQKTTTSQGKVIEAMTDARNSLSARLVRMLLCRTTERPPTLVQGSAEKEIISHQQNNRAYQDRIAELVAAANDKDLELQGAERRLAEVCLVYSSVESGIS